MNGGIDSIAVKTYKYVDHSTIRDIELVVYRIELRIEGHRLFAIRTHWMFPALKECRLSAQLVASSDVLWRPPERRKRRCYVIERLRNEFERRYLFNRNYFLYG